MHMYFTCSLICMILLLLQMIRLLSTILHHYEGVSGDGRAAVVKPDLQEESDEKGNIGLESCNSLHIIYYDIVHTHNIYICILLYIIYMICVLLLMCTEFL